MFDALAVSFHVVNKLMSKTSKDNSQGHLLKYFPCMNVQNKIVKMFHPSEYDPGLMYSDIISSSILVVVVISRKKLMLARILYICQ